MIRLFAKIGMIKTILLILLIYIFFIIYIAFFKYNIYSDLISDNYYEEEIRYQKIINDKINVKNLKNNVNLKLNKYGIILKFPKPFNNKNIIGELSIIRFSDKKKDIYDKLILNNKNEYFISSKKFKNGLYQLKLKWIYNKYKSYFIEKTIIWKN